MRHIKFLIPVYAITLLLSAALLFAVQPMYSKMILPLLGGSPQVWNTAMVFFQIMLLAGYVYAHLIHKFLPLTLQAFVHIVLLGAFFTFLPFGVSSDISPPDTGQSFWQLSLMFATIGGPFFILAGSAPLFQAWFANTDHPDADNPYFLYGASNLGSMSALLAYPFFIEPFLALSEQALGWTYGYACLFVCVVLCAGLAMKAATFKSSNKKAAKKTSKNTKKKSAKKDAGVTMQTRLGWLFLAFIPSSLMLGVTTFITTDVASVPLLWIIPLALYVSTFILAFARKPLFKHKDITLMHGVSILGLICFMIFLPNPGILPVFVHLLVFFIIALSCHTELSALKPSADKLTEFYVLLSIGGALGGIFNALIAPIVFTLPLEYPFVLVLSCLARYLSVPDRLTIKSIDRWFLAGGLVAFLILFINSYDFLDKLLILPVIVCAVFLLDKRVLFTLLIFGGILSNPPGAKWNKDLFEKVHYTSRNFFGVLRVIDTTDGYRIMLHGTTDHGAQALAEEYKYTPLSYYSKHSPISDVVRVFDERGGKQHFAVLGLGSGVMSCFTAPMRTYDFFEIDPAVIDVAENPEYFTFLSGCGSKYKVYLGDARLEIKNQENEEYDMIMADAFSSDNIPVHLITKEAAQLYLSKLKPDGILVFHISNNYLDMEPVLHENAKVLGIHARVKAVMGGTIEGTEIPYHATSFVVFTRSDEVVKTLEDMGWDDTMPRSGVRSWTDQYSNIIRVLIPKSISKRYRAQTKAKEEVEKIAEKE